MFYISPVVRFLLGLGAGLEITISPVYIHETTMRDMRDICGSFPQVGHHIYLSWPGLAKKKIYICRMMEIPMCDILPQLRLWLQWRLSIFPLVCHHMHLYLGYIAHHICSFVTSHVLGASCAALGGPFRRPVIAACVLKRDISVFPQTKATTHTDN